MSGGEVVRPLSRAVRGAGLWQLGRLLPAASRPLAAATAFHVVLGAALPAAAVVTTAALIGAVPEAARGGPGSPAAASLWRAFLLLVVVHLVQHVAMPLLGMASDLLAQRVDEHLTLRVMAVAARPHTTDHLEDAASLDRLAQAAGSLNQGSGGMAVRSLVSASSARLSGVVTGAVLLHYRWWLAVAVTATAFGMVVFWQRNHYRMTSGVYAQSEQLRRAGMLTSFGMEPRPAAEVRIFGLAGWLAAKMDATWQAGMREAFASWRTGWTSRATTAVPGALAAGAGLLVVADGVRGAISLGEASAYLGALLAIRNLPFLPDADRNVQAGVALLEALQQLEGDDDARRAAAGTRLPPPDVPAGSIHFEGVRFSYPGRSDPVFDGLDLELRAGESTAVVGRNGAGKTTLVKLLARLREPQGGRITVDGVDVREYDPAAWQRRISCVFQSFARYPLSALENVALGAPERQDDVGAVVAAARRVGIAEAVESLPAGWQTPLDRQLSGGATLSDGQWQRLAIARALFAVGGGARILVLDEPTAALDVRAEAELYDRFFEITHGVTSLVISHRFSTVRRAQTIVVVDEGRVVERGTHDELMDRGGMYADLFSAQASAYADGTPESR